MAYHKALEEKKWKQWKANEEIRLREAGMGEHAIEILRKQDWEVFKAERRYRERQILSPALLSQQAVDMEETEVTDTDRMLEVISDERILQVLLSADQKTLQIILLRYMGFSNKEIAEKSGMCEKTIYTRMRRLAEKIKNFK